MSPDASSRVGRMGPLALHGGGEFVADEGFLRELLEAAARGRAGSARTRSGGTGSGGGTASERAGLGGGEVGSALSPDRAVRIAILTTAAARHRPGLAFATGAAAMEQVAAGAGLEIRLVEARAVDDASAADATIVERLASADLVYLPGGDPGVVLDVLAGAEALRAVQRARLRGAVVAGASAGAMALAAWTWTPDGVRRGFGWLRDVLVLPHATPERVAAAARERRRLVDDERIAILLLDERTGVIEEVSRPEGRGPGLWRVAGAGSAHLLAPHAAEAESFPSGTAFHIR